MGWCHGFKLNCYANDSGEAITFRLYRINVMTEIAGWTVFAKVLFGKILLDRGYIKQELFDSLFSQGISNSFMGPRLR